MVLTYIHLQSQYHYNFRHIIKINIKYKLNYYDIVYNTYPSFFD